MGMISVSNAKAGAMIVVTIKINGYNFITDFTKLMMVVATDYKYC